MWTKSTQRNALISSKGTTEQLNNDTAFSQEKREQIVNEKAR